MARSLQKPVPWLPVDSRFFSFGHVRGVTRVFLILEMMMAVLIVLGTLAIVIIDVFLQ